MTIDTEIVESAGNVLKEFLQTTDEPKLVENIQKLLQKEEANEFLNKLKQIVIEVNNWNLEEVQSLTNQIGSEIEDSKFRTIMNLFQNQLILLLFNKTIEKTDNIDLKIQTMLNKVPILDEAFQLAQMLREENITAKLFKENFETFATLGILSLNSGDIQSALHYFGKDLTLFRENKELLLTKHSFILILLSNLIVKIRHSPDLLKFAKNALNLDFENQDPFQAAFKLVNQAITIDHKAKNSPSLALDFYNLSLLYNERQMYSQGIRELQKARKIHEELEDRVGMLNDMILLGTLMNNNNQKDEALEVYNKAQNIAVDMDLRNKIGQLNLLMSSVLRDKKDYDESLKQLKTALVIFKQEKMGQDVDLIASYTGLGSLLRIMQEKEAARAFLEKILDVEKSSGSKSLLMELYSQLAMTYAQLDNLEEFDKNYREVISLNQIVKDPMQFANSEYQIGVTFSNQQKFQEGLNHLGRALKIFNELKSESKISTILRALSLVYAKLNQPQLAEEISDESQDVMTRSQYVFEKGSISDLEIPEIPPPPKPALKPAPKPKAPIIPPPKAAPPSKPPTATPIIESKLPTATPIIESKPPTATPVIESPPEPPKVTSIPSPPKIKPIPKIAKQVPPPEPSPPPAEARAKPAVRACPKCDFKVDNPDFAFCPKCAAQLETTRICQKCGFKVENTDFKFCPKCANPLD